MRFNRQPLYLQVREAMASRIASGEWKIDQPIPNESDLAREFGISAGTMRKSLDMLEEEGLLIRRQGRGSFIADKQANDDLRRKACYDLAGTILRRAREEAEELANGQSDVDGRTLNACLRKQIAEALFEAGRPNGLSANGN